MELSSIKIFGSIIFLTSFSMIMMGCGTRHYKQFELSNVNENQGVIIGKIDIKYNYRPFDSTGCRFCAGSACQYLLDDGYVFMSVGKGPLTQGRLSCSYPNIYYTVKSFEVGSDIIYFGNLIFTVYDTSPAPNTPPVRPTPAREKPEVDYFEDYERRKMNGEVTSHVDAIAKGVIDDTVSSLFSSDGTSGPRAPYIIYFDVSVKDGMTEVVKVFRSQVKNKDVNVEKNIFDIKLEPEYTTVYR
jgi:hypothetical protein